MQDSLVADTVEYDLEHLVWTGLMSCVSLATTREGWVYMDHDNYLRATFSCFSLKTEGSLVEQWNHLNNKVVCVNKTEVLLIDASQMDASRRDAAHDVNTCVKSKTLPGTKNAFHLPECDSILVLMDQKQALWNYETDTIVMGSFPSVLQVKNKQGHVIVESGKAGEWFDFVTGAELKTLVCKTTVFASRGSFWVVKSEKGSIWWGNKSTSPRKLLPVWKELISSSRLILGTSGRFALVREETATLFY